MSTRDMHVEIDDSYKRSDGYKIGHNLCLMVDIDRGTIRSTGDILARHHQCGPLMFVNILPQIWTKDCVITFKYNKAYQQNSADFDYALTFIGDWTRTDRYPNEFDYTTGIPEIGDYWMAGADITITPPPSDPNTTQTFKTGEFMILTSFVGDDPVWTKGTIGWHKTFVRDRVIYEPIFLPVLDSGGNIAEFTGSVTIPAGTRAYVQHYFNDDYVYKVYDITISDSTQRVRIYALADNGMRLLYGFNTEYLRNIIEYLHRRYFPSLDECPTCDGTGLVSGSTCPDCNGYKYLANPNELLPDGNYDYLTDILAEVKGYRKQSETYESYRWKVWSKYWWKVPITERIKEYVGHFLRIDPESINIVKPQANSDGVIAECIWKIEIELADAGDIIDITSTDQNIKELIYEISPAGTNVIITRLIGFEDGEYKDYEDNYWEDPGPTEVISPKQLNYGCVCDDFGQDILSGRCVKTHHEDIIFSTGMNRTEGTYSSGVGTTSLVISETLTNVNSCSGILYVEGTRYDYTNYNSATQTFTLTANYGVHIDTNIEIFYNTAERETLSDHNDFYYNVSQTDYIKYIEMDVPISIKDSSNIVRKWDDKI
jgi:hypothetical protein